MMKLTASRRARTGFVVLAFVASMSVVVVLAMTADNIRRTPGSFLRLFPSHAVEEGPAYDLKVNSYYIAGGTDSLIYLANHTAPLHLLQLSYNLKDTIHIRLNVPGIFDDKYWSVRVRVDAPYFYLHDGAVPRIFRGSMNNWTAHRFPLEDEFFLDLLPINGESFFIKSLVKNGDRTILGKISNGPDPYTFNGSLLEKQVDGIFCTDGKMVVNKDLNSLLYVYRYRNEFMMMDTSLNLYYRATTIDTNSIAKIKVATVNQQKKLAAPPVIVNKGAATYYHWLLINSDLLSKNEHRRALEDASVIDVYDLHTRSYAFSFYIFNYGDQKMKDFEVHGDHLVAMFDTYLQVFDMRTRYFKE